MDKKNTLNPSFALSQGPDTALPESSRPHPSEKTLAFLRAFARAYRPGSPFPAALQNVSC